MLMWDAPPAAHAAFSLLIGGGGLVIALLFGTIAQDHYFALLDAGPLWLCLGLGLMLGALLPVALRRWLPRVAFHPYPTSFVVLPLAAPLFCVAVGLGVNRWLDSSPPTPHRTRVLRHVSSKGPGWCELVSWRTSVPERFAADHSLSDIVGRCASGTELVAVTRRGALGWEWVERFQAAP